MAMIELRGALEIDTDRGVIWFHVDQPQKYHITVLRICQLPKPIPDPAAFGLLDLVWGASANYRASPCAPAEVTHG